MNEHFAVAGAEDAALLASSRAGDVAAFGQLIERYHNLVCAIAYSRTGDRSASEDIAQETFLAAWRGLDGLRDPDKLRGWLCGIARNLGEKSTRRTRRETVTDHEELAGEATDAPGPLGAMLTKELETTVWAALEKLPATYREPLVLFYREDQSIKQVAEGLGLTEETAKQRLSRGRNSLREHMGELVEQALAAGRPRKAAAAAVIALIVAAHGKPALAAPVAKTKWIAAGVGMCAAVAIGVVATRTQHAAPRATATIAQLQQTRAAWQAAHGGAGTCELHGTVARADGATLAGATVAILEQGVQASSLEPTIVETSDRGAWRTTLPAGAYTVSIAARGQRARLQSATCGSELAVVLQPAAAALRGVTSDAGGGPVADATIYLSDARRPAELFVTRSAADGSYELAVDRGQYSVIAMHPAYTLEVRPVTVGAKGAREDVTLLPGASIEGTVVDATGSPIAGAKVAARAPAPSGDEPLRWRLSTVYAAMLPATTDERGRFALRGLPPGTVQLAARAPGFASERLAPVTLTLAESKTDVKLELAPAHEITGFVVAQGAGVAGARVLALREDQPLAMPMMSVTDGAGHFVLDGLSPGVYRVVAASTGFAPYVAPQPVTMVANDVTDTIISLERGVTVRGRIESIDRPVIELRSADALTAALLRAEVDERGAFAIEGVPPGDYTVVATTFDQRGEQPLHVGSSSLDVRMELAAMPALGGIVVDDAGAPVPGALVAATEKRGPHSLFTTVRTDDTGAFDIVGMRAGTYDVRVYDARGQRAWANELRRPFDARRVEVTSPVRETLTVNRGTGQISGLVVGVDRKPVADAWIEVRAREAHRRPALFPSPPILTDAHGQFTVDDLTGSELEIEAVGPDGSLRASVTTAPGATVSLVLAPLVTVAYSATLNGAPVPSVEARLDRGMPLRTGTLSALAGTHELTLTAPGGYARQTVQFEPGVPLTIALTPWASLRGVAMGSDGAPWPDAMVMLRESLEPMLVRTDARGRFSIDHVIAGPNELSIISDAKFTTVDLELAPGQQLDLGSVGSRLRSARTSSDTSADLGLKMSTVEGALMIVAVIPGSVSARAGLRAGDRITQVGLTKVDADEAKETMMSLTTPWRSRGRAVPFTVLRDGRELRVELLVPN